MTFIEECLKKGANSIALMQIEAKKEASLLEKEIQKLDFEKNSKIERFKEVSNFLKQFEEPKTNTSVILNTTWNDLSDDLKYLCLDIIKQICDCNKIPATKITSQILDPDKRKNSIIAVKWLLDQKILSRIDKDISKGVVWDKRSEILGEGCND